MKALMLTISMCAAIAIAGCGDDDSATDDTGGAPATETAAPAADLESKPGVERPDEEPGKLVERDLVEGSGATAKAGDEVTVQYVGVGFDSEEEFDASWDRGEPFSFQLGAGAVIPGWDQGVEGMKVGGRRELVIPPNLAYGEAGSPPAIGPSETLVFVVDLLEVN